MPNHLYEQDILVWAEQQAALLRRLSQGDRVNADVDWPHVIEEVQDVGLSELHACESQLRQALLHLLKLKVSPGGPARHWRREIVGFLGDAQRRFAPSMRPRIDLEAVYQLALRQLRAGEKRRKATPGLPETCPLTLDDLLSQTTEIDELEAKLDHA